MFFEIILPISLAVIWFYASTAMGLSFRNEDLDGNIRYGMVSFASALALISVITGIIFIKTNSTAISLLSFTIGILLTVPSVVIYFWKRHEISNCHKSKKLYSAFYDKILKYACEKGSFTDTEYEAYVEDLILKETPYKKYSHSEYNYPADNPNYDTYMDAAKEFAYSYPKTFIIDPNRGRKPKEEQNEQNI